MRLCATPGPPSWKSTAIPLSAGSAQSISPRRVPAWLNWKEFPPQRISSHRPSKVVARHRVGHVVAPTAVAAARAPETCLQIRGEVVPAHPPHRPCIGHVVRDADGAGFTRGEAGVADQVPLRGHVELLADDGRASSRGTAEAIGQPPARAVVEVGERHGRPGRATLGEATRTARSAAARPCRTGARAAAARPCGAPARRRKYTRRSRRRPRCRPARPRRRSCTRRRPTFPGCTRGRTCRPCHRRRPCCRHRNPEQPAPQSPLQSLSASCLRTPAAGRPHAGGAGQCLTPLTATSTLRPFARGRRRMFTNRMAHHDTAASGGGPGER